MPQLPLIPIAMLVAALAAIFALAQQGVKGTGDLAWRAEQLLLKLIPPTGTGDIGEPTWFGLTIRRIAHIVEYAVLAAVALVVACALQPTPLGRMGLALTICFVASVADEAHKAFVPGRHFDAWDLCLDALGYAPVICLWAAVVTLLG
ncbi:MAG: VanZ family protein [Atopobiaceae bacterium]|nr:VanZ family protein [Atopobiaceae bacterium]